MSGPSSDLEKKMEGGKVTILHIIIYIIQIFIYKDSFINLGHQYSMIYNLLQNIICMTLKQGNMVVLHNDNINNIHYKLGLNIDILFNHQESIHVVEYFEKHIKRPWIASLHFLGFTVRPVKSLHRFSILHQVVEILHKFGFLPK